MTSRAGTDRVTEHEVAHAACIVLATRTGREATIRVLVKEIPNVLRNSLRPIWPAPRRRRNAAVWEQQITEYSITS